MLDDIRPLGLADAARTLGIDPFEVVRLLVVAGALPDQLRLTQDHVDKVREVGGIEQWWNPGNLPDDKDPRRRVARGVCGGLVERKVIGERTTRMDNLWRGLSPEEQEVAQVCVAALAQEAVLSTSASVRGVQVSVSPEAVALLKKFAAGGEAPSALAVALAG